MTTDNWTDHEWHIERQRRQQRRLGTFVTHSPGCDGAEDCGGVYRCSRCRRLFGWCCGGGDGSGTDERDEMCDDCYVEVTCSECDGIKRKAGRPAKGGRCDNPNCITHEIGQQP